MQTLKTNRRNVLMGAAAAFVASSLPALAQNNSTLHVIKDPDCGCCGAWIKIMRMSGFDVTVQNASNEALYGYKLRNGITEELASCHTATIDGYFVEGHVPPADVRRLLAERPDAIGLTVPGMPYGSPGMGPESERDTYSVLLIRKDGETEVFAHYNGA
ncbi:DUF411 domain-containing protein [Alisedimentitalea sp. MJ-SS2]|uniref:DUF411 domain-containing protein n=1 Tax=Aliisedimentitalea sp. MJ-SS2 TaxID=3049795 RepID=UPI002911F7DF|nr:DUF411 domain-containing protein [Alisedimentitalea sp. MJ-SS2]MDU8929827.1 DUF411 domain-containing protein [Alisedimentitalea sp. MJ-SS2]